MSRRRWFDVVAVALTVAVAGVIGYALRPQHTPTVAKPPAEVRIERPQPPGAPTPSMLFIGDSYSSGSGLKEAYYGCLAAAQLQSICDTSIESGTGYVSGGDANRFVFDQNTGEKTRSFDERLTSLGARYRPDAVVLDGGRNDRFAPPEAVVDVMVATVEHVRSIWPTARIVVIRPRLLDRPGDDLGFGDDLIGRLSTIPGVENVTVVDPIARFIDTDVSGLTASPGGPPNRPGEQALAGALVDSLQAAAPPAAAA